MNILFDIGKVLLDFDFEASLRQLLPPGTPESEVDARLTRMLADKDRFESGAIEADDYIPWALEILDHDLTPEAFIHAWQNIFTPIDPMWRSVEKLHADGHRLILFSNTNAIHCPWVFEHFDIFDKFEGAILSYQVGCIKPKDEIYHRAASDFHLIPSETLYIDDLPANIATGTRLGYRSHQYNLHHHSSYERWLSAQLSR